MLLPRKLVSMSMKIPEVKINRKEAIVKRQAALDTMTTYAEPWTPRLPRGVVGLRVSRVLVAGLEPTARSLWSTGVYRDRVGLVETSVGRQRHQRPAEVGDGAVGAGDVTTVGPRCSGGNYNSTQLFGVLRYRPSYYSPIKECWV